MSRPGAPQELLKHMPQLDGLRAFAVGAVLIHHLLDPALLSRALGGAELGLLGVTLFFVLSGFLITGLLLKARDEAQRGERSGTFVIRQFYARRVLRIFPLYYLVLAIAIIWGPADAREQLPWLATYTYNFWISHLGWYPAYFAHFWSLCVEEQFYLLWPCVVVFAPRIHLRSCAVAMVISALLFRWSALTFEFNSVAFYTLTPSSLDALGVGALLAIHTHGAPASKVLERRLRLIVVPAALAGLLVLLNAPTIWDISYQTFIAVMFVWLVAAASRGFGGVGRMLLEAAPVTYIGRISYGIYVYHAFVPDVMKAGFKTFGLAPLQKDFLGFLVFSTVSIALASISWLAFERPINRLKQRLSYAQPKQPGTPRLAASEVPP